ncbi:L,D-transpeptidase family protein [Streptomyces sp. CC208A]|uniref:L,D-transpeptidase family protein n=1 Tax=Streptomyces sp. CC208A TaxID=3044573 RepID=UPI0024A8378B|nr:L,D-transpeptidase family protein [Streptomyces sp. CC208A]
MPAFVRKGAPALLGAGTLCAALLLTGCAHPAPTTPPTTVKTSAAPTPSGATEATDARPDGVSRIPGIGPLTQARLPDGTAQALVVTGDTENSNTATAVLHQRGPDGRWYQAGGPWSARNALKGWTADHVAGDLRTPTGVFRLGDAGGRLPDPGARLPYDEDPEFAISGTGFHGEPLEGSFDHVIAIDYNRVPGRTPLDKERPLGAGKGGGVWIHVDHGGPTQACVALDRDDLRTLLVALDPAAEPVVVMGPAPELAR